MLVWEEASMRGRPVTVLPVPSANGQHDMEVRMPICCHAHSCCAARPLFPAFCKPASQLRSAAHLAGL